MAKHLPNHCGTSADHGRYGVAADIVAESLATLVSRRLSMSRTARGVRPLSWRVRAYDGEYLQHGAPLPLIAEISGNANDEPSIPIEHDRAQRCLLAVVLNLDCRRMAGDLLHPFARVSGSMTVFVEELESDGLAAGHVIARLDLMREADIAHGSLLMENQPRIDLETVKIEPADGVLDVFLRLLAFMVH
jgi:hypothetical protein